MSRLPAGALTFDCYGTLVQWREPLADGIAEVAARHCVDASREDLVAQFMTCQFELVCGPYRPFREILAATLSRTMRAHGAKTTKTDVSSLVARLSALAPMPDVPEALVELRRWYRLVIISNTEDDLIAGTLRGLPVDFDVVVTAGQIGAYKPSPLIFGAALDRIGMPREQVVHVAAGFPYDIAPACSLGLRSVWVNRAGESRDTPAPTLVARSFAALPALLEPTLQEVRHRG